jgi:hypothetical protein
VGSDIFSLTGTDAVCECDVLSGFCDEAGGIVLRGGSVCKEGDY